MVIRHYSSWYNFLFNKLNYVFKVRHNTDRLDLLVKWVGPKLCVDHYYYLFTKN